jgi:hypothetical protein
MITLFVIILLSVIAVFLTHFFLAKILGYSLAQFYAFYTKDEFFTIYLIANTGFLWCIFLITLFAINNTYLHFPC